MADDKVTLWVGISFSSCEACGQNALPQEQTHDRSPAWSDTDRKGCGARFTHIGSSYGVPAERLREMRPDLEVIDLFPSDASLGAASTTLNPPPGEHTNLGDSK